MFRRIRKRPYAGPGRKYFRKPFARAKGNYELLLTPNFNAGGVNDPSQVLVFRTAGQADAALQVATPTLGGPEEPINMATFGATGTTFVTVQEGRGFSGAVALWDPQLASVYGHQVKLRALRGYLFPSAIGLLVSSMAKSTGTLFVVRAELLALDVSEAEALFGNANRSSIEPIVSFSRSYQRKRIWWQNEWLMPMNNLSPFEYFRNTDTTSGGLNPFQCGLMRSHRVNIKNPMTITRERWPVLVWSIAGAFDSTATANDPGSSFNTLVSTAVLSLNYFGRLRAYLEH